jgi:hypothetical protein
MPAFGGNHDREDIIGMTAIIKKLPEFNDLGHAEFVNQARAQDLGEDHHHGASAPDAPDDHGHDNDAHHH